MEFKYSYLYREVLNVQSGGDKKVVNLYTTVLHLKDRDITPLKMVDLSIFRDYEKNTGDETSIKLMVGFGDWAKHIYESRDDLELTIRRTPLIENSGIINLSEDTYSQRFKAVVKIEGLPVIKGTDYDIYEDFALDAKFGILEIELQLIDKTILETRMLTVGGVWRKTRTDDVIRNILTAETQKMELDDEVAIGAVDVALGDNTELKEHVLIPHGTVVTDVPKLVQNKCGGVFNTGIGSFVQQGTWFVYPLYNTERLDECKKKITIIKTPSNISRGGERTYREDGDSITIVATAQSSFSDSAGADFIQSGAGVRYAKADNFMSDSLITTGKDNKAIISRAKNNSEYAVVESSNTKIAPVYTSSAVITANSFRENTKLLSRKGAVYTFVWDNARPELITPGACVKILHLNNEDVEELSGVVLGNQILTQLAGKGMTSSRHITTCALSIFVNQIEAGA